MTPSDGTGRDSATGRGSDHGGTPDDAGGRRPPAPREHHPLDVPVRSSLEGAHAGFAERRGRVLRYHIDVTPFAELPDRPTAADWADLAALTGPGGTASLAGQSFDPPPPGWRTVFLGEGVQMDGSEVVPAPFPEAVRLGPEDAEEMLDLVARTRPGPFLHRTVELGTYLGVRREGKLVAMAGERMRPRGWTEISGVCTDDAHRGQGLAGRLVRAVAEVVRARGERPFLHASADNTGAIRLYESLGFRLRRPTVFHAVQAPADRLGDGLYDTSRRQR